MHITIFVYGSWGDLRPHVVLGMALQEWGHDVQVVGRIYEDWVRARDLGFSPLSVDVGGGGFSGRPLPSIPSPLHGEGTL